MSNDYGYICKACAGPAPIGIGYTHAVPGARDMSAAISVCACGYSATAKVAA